MTRIETIRNNVCKSTHTYERVESLGFSYDRRIDADIVAGLRPDYFRGPPHAHDGSRDAPGYAALSKFLKVLSLSLFSWSRQAETR